MKLIFNWCQSFYDTNQNWHEDAEILFLKIEQRECSFASANLTVFLNDEETQIKKYARIGAIFFDEHTNREEIRPIFVGRVISFPLSFEKSCVQLELLSEPENYQQQLQAFAQKNFEYYSEYDKNSVSEKFINFDELFFDKNDVKNFSDPSIFLESDSKCFYWDMKSGKLSLSDVNIGEKNIEISCDQILSNSVKVSLEREPYKSVNMILSASWIQHSSGLIDLYPLIASKFQNGIISSFTNIKNKIKELGKFWNRQGYFSLQCEVQEANPANTSVPLSKTSREFAVDNDNTGEKINVRFKKFYFQGKMLIGWNHRQRRSENIHVRITNKNITNGRDKNIFVKLNSIQLPKQYPQWNFFAFYKKGEKVIFNNTLFECKEEHFSAVDFDESKWKNIEKIPDALPNDNCRSFFETPRGKNAIKYAIQNATALLNYSSRYVKISFCITADENFLSLININNQITLVDKLHRKISGKIIRTKFIATEKNKIMQITIGCSLGKNISGVQEKINQYITQLDITKLLKDENKITASDIVRDIFVTNLPEDQEEILARANAKSIAELKSQLKKHATKIKVCLSPINSKQIIVNDIKVPEFSA